MANVYLAVILLSCLSIFTTLAGVMLALKFRDNKRGIAIGIGFSAGIVLVISFVELLPEAAKEAGALATVMTATLGGMLLFALHWVIPHAHLVEERGGLGGTALKSAYLVVLGLILHDFPEGLAMANSYIASPSLGVLVTRTLSKAHSLAGFRVGYAILPEALADDLNTHNDAYPLARPSQAAALATLQHEDKIRERASSLRAWTGQLAGELQVLGVRTYPTETYFFLADFAPHDAAELAERLRGYGIFVKPLGDPILGSGFMRVTTALPDDNTRVVQALRELL